MLKNKLKIRNTKLRKQTTRLERMLLFHPEYLSHFGESGHDARRFSSKIQDVCLAKEEKYSPKTKSKNHVLEGHIYH